MTVELLTNKIWFEITNRAKETKKICLVSVAYFGLNGAKMLPLSKGSTLLVDASLKALRNGQTCPDELLKLYYKGVHIYSLENLYAKIFVFGNVLYCGSTNVSGNSANRLKEALIKTTDKFAIADAKNFIKSFCRIELGDDELTRMKKFYKPPKFFSSPRDDSNENAEFHICKLVIRNWTKDEEHEAEKGRTAAEKNRINKSRHRIDEFVFNRQIKFKRGDTILQIIEENSKSYVLPIGKLIHIRKWSNGNKTKYFCYVEVPDRRRKKLEILKRKLEASDSKLNLRSGRKGIELETIIKKLWQ